MLSLCGAISSHGGLWLLLSIHSSTGLRSWSLSCACLSSCGDLLPPVPVSRLSPATWKIWKLAHVSWSLAGACSSVTDLSQWLDNIWVLVYWVWTVAPGSVDTFNSSCDSNLSQCLHVSLQHGCLDRASTLPCLTPGRCSMVKSYCWRLSIHLAIWPSGWLKFSSQRRTEWLVRIINFLP